MGRSAERNHRNLTPRGCVDPGNFSGGFPMLKWIVILLIVAAVASLLGFSSISGAAMTGAKLLIGILLILFLLVILGVVAIA